MLVLKHLASTSCFSMAKPETVCVVQVYCWTAIVSQQVTLPFVRHSLLATALVCGAASPR